MAESKKTNWKTTDKRFVAFLDILGFKDSVMRNTHDDIYSKLTSINKVKKTIENSNNNESFVEYYFDSEVYIVNFSDSIVIFSKNDDVYNFEYFLVAVRYLFGKCIDNGIPVKGGVAYGEVSVNKSEQIYFGQPIIDAYLLEEDLNHFGIVLHNSVDKYILDNSESLKDLKYYEKSLFSYKVPLKYGKIHHSNINWFKMLIESKESDDFDLKKKEVLSKLNQFYVTCSGSPRKYVDNSIDLFEELLSKNIINLDKKASHNNGFTI
ncbi:hypothetical protein [Flavobacterium sp.]|uniref:hypothetical protein n=1 Tax=Flavobacterium sp. TaxID=239 RepID=UPI00391B7D25